MKVHPPQRKEGPFPAVSRQTTDADAHGAEADAAAYEASLLLSALRGTSYEPAATAALTTLRDTLRTLKQEHDQR